MDRIQRGERQIKPLTASASHAPPNAWTMVGYGARPNNAFTSASSTTEPSIRSAMFHRMFWAGAVN